MRSAAYVCGWAAVTALSASIVWVGLRPVLAAAVPEPVPLRVEALTGSPSPLPAPSRPVPLVSPVPSPAGLSSPVRSPATVRVSPSAGKPGAKPSQVAPQQTVDGWQVFTESDGSRSYLRSFPTDGGTAVIRIAGARVYLVSATPRGDYRVTTSQPGPDRVVVQFHNSARQIIVDAIWWEERPYAEVTVVE